MERKERPQQQLNCPRCKSNNTKFCYYNNYSLSQPRYFCKSCRRYWTAGGSLRNIPVGGGSRKNRKPSSSQTPPPELGFPAPSSSVSPALDLQNTHRSFSSYIPNLMPYAGAGDEMKVPMQEDAGGRFAFSFADQTKQQLFSGGGEENSGGYWSGMLGGGPW